MNQDKEQVFISLIDEYQKILHSVCRIYTDNSIDHEDLFQEMLVQLWNGYARYKGESKISTWIYRVSLYTAITYIKKVVKRRTIKDHSEIDLVYYQKTEESKEDLLLIAIKRLAAADRGFILLYLEDKSYKEMSEILGISESNVGVKLNRIKNKLKAIMTN